MRRGVVRWTYFVALASMLAWITASAVGGYAYKAADGLVVGEMGQISPEYTVTVLEVLVKNGDRVNRGDLIARVSSSRVAEIMATLSMQSTTLGSRMAEITAKAGVIDQLVGSAETRDRVVAESNDKLQIQKERGFLPWVTTTSIADQVYKGKSELARLRSEKESMAGEVAQIVAASRSTDQAILDLATLFDAGRMKAPMDGFISGVEVGPGSVVNPGGIVADMVGADRFVVAYFPVSRVYALKVGAPVTVEVGFGRWFTGSISRIEPIAGRLRPEFQKTLSPVDRQQLVRIDFDNAQAVPYFTKVIIR